MRRAAFNLPSLAVEVVEQSIVDLPRRVDAIVSSDDNYLSHGGGVSQAIWTAAGTELADFVEENLPPLRIGQVWKTPAGSLRSRWILHAITIDLDDYRRALPRDLQELYRGVLAAADEEKWRSVAVPLLGGGAAAQQDASIASLATVLADRVRLSPRVGAPLRLTVAVVGDSFDAVEKVFSEKLPGSQASRAMLVPATGAIVGTAVGKFLSTFPASRTNRGGPEHLGALGAKLALLAGDAEYAGLLETTLRIVLDVALREARKLPATEDSPPPHPVTIKASRYVLAPDADRASVGAWAEAARWLLTRTGHPLTPAADSAISEAVAARNRLVHARVGDPAEERRVLLDAIDHLDRWARENIGTDWTSVAWKAFENFLDGAVATSQQLSLHVAFEEVPDALFASSSLAAAKPRRSSRRSRRAGVVEPQRDETAPVIRLHRLLTQRLAPDDLRHLLRRLDAKNYVGTDDLRLMEYCVAEDDLVGLLTREFTIGALHRILEEETGAPANVGKTHEELARALLEHLGFPSVPPVQGLLSVNQVLSRARAAADHGDLAALRSAIIDAVAAFETLLKLYIRFLCKWLFDQTPEAAIRDHAWAQHGELEKHTTGTLVAICARIGTELRDGTSMRLAAIRKDVPDRPLVPPVANELAAHRNRVIHPDRQVPQLTAEQVRNEARAFLDGALQVVAYLAEPDVRVFPFVVRIDRIVIDRNGRRVIEATSDGDPGRELERIFTAGELRPGELYLMRPLSNPLRVDPVLVPAGDLSRAQPRPADA